MHGHTKSDVKSIVGGLGFSYKQLWSPNIHYVDGCEEADIAIRNKDVYGPIIPIIRKAKRGIWISLSQGRLKSCILGIPNESVRKIFYTDLNNKKMGNGSIASSAIVGAAIAGPLGAIIGTLNSMALAEGGLLLTIDCESEGRSENLRFYIPVVHKKDADNFFTSFGDVFTRPPV